MAKAADELRVRAQQLHEDAKPVDMPWEALSRRQQQVLTRLLLSSFEEKAAHLALRPADIKSWFQVSAPTARAWLHDWVDDGFLEPMGTDQIRRVRTYQLSPAWRELIESALEAAAVRETDKISKNVR